jgi:hypothetical protein
MVDREGQIGEWSRWQFMADEHHPPRRPRRRHQRVIKNLTVVVHEKLAVERIEERGQRAADDEEGSEPPDGSRGKGGHAVGLIHARGTGKRLIPGAGTAT